jgi:Na+-translocating ferredoxin:NAD+ oxidoreductase RnfD subunit
MNSVLLYLYLGGVFHGLKLLAIVAGLFVIGIFFKVVEESSGEKFKKGAWVCGIILSVCLAVVILLPNRVVMYSMAAAEFGKSGVSEIIGKEMADGLKSKIMKVLED